MTSDDQRQEIAEAAAEDAASVAEGLALVANLGPDPNAWEGEARPSRWHLQERIGYWPSDEAWEDYRKRYVRGLHAAQEIAEAAFTRWGTRDVEPDDHAEATADAVDAARDAADPPGGAR